MDADRRDDIAEAMDKAASAAPEPTPTTDVVTPAPIGDAPSQETTPIGDVKSDRPRRADGTFAKKEEAAQEKAEAKPEKPLEAPKPVSLTPEPSKAPEAPRFKPPQSWKPTVREKWEKLDPEVQAEATRREREINTALQEASEARQFHSKFREVTQPYEMMFRSQGVEPIQGIQGLLQTAAALATSPVQTRAQIMANLIKTYLPGEEGIKTLDSVLAGTPMESVRQPEVYRDPRVDQLYAQIEQAKSAREKEVQAKAAAAIAEVENEEFFEDVRDEMADLMELASRRGIALSPRDAYNRAVAVHPEVSKVVEQRKAAANSNGSTQRSVAAASSIRSSPASGLSSDQPKELRDQIAAAWDQVAQRSR